MPAAIRVEVLDLRGTLVRTLSVSSIDGPATLTWDGRGEGGVPVADGTYLIRLQSGERYVVSKVVKLAR